VELELKGQAAVVTGGAQGIGRAIARAFAAEGACVALIDRDPGVGATADGIAAEFGMNVNIQGAVNVAHAFTPPLREARRGTLLFISSVAGQIGSQTDPPYSASKAALINFAQCAAKDLAPFDVRVNTLCPGMVKTAVNRAVWEAWTRQQPEDQRRSYEEWADEKVRRVVPLGRWQTGEDIAAMAVFLASPRADNITGQTLNVDGGFVMHW
jgi:NAD(P)-dependent dehydrogenase (short-subunit alcohol dehydrogenase family)